jgi:hypothetical protein
VAKTFASASTGACVFPVTQKYTRRKAISANTTPLKRTLVGFHGAITICPEDTFEAYLACDGSHLREITETKPLQMQFVCGKN